MFSENLQSASASDVEYMKSRGLSTTSNEAEYNKMQENIMEIGEWLDDELSREQTIESKLATIVSCLDFAVYFDLIKYQDSVNLFKSKVSELILKG